jgi:hypothetical protein
MESKRCQPLTEIARGQVSRFSLFFFGTFHKESKGFNRVSL